MKKIIAFDLDGTLSESKQPISRNMAQLLASLLWSYEVCIISGGAFKQFGQQVIQQLNRENDLGDKLLERLHIMPTCGSQYFRYNSTSEKFEKVYLYDFSVDEKDAIIDGIQATIDELGFRETETFGEIIEDRGSQITFSALGQEAPIEKKQAWDANGTKKKQLRDSLAEKFPCYEVKTGGSTSVDITMHGIDKAFGMYELMKYTRTLKREILFIGDQLQYGGNDNPVDIMGIDCIQVSNPHDTEMIIQTIKALY